MRKAQGSIELVIILVFALAIFLVILTITTDIDTSLGGQYRTDKARALVDDIADAATLVYQQGVGAKTRVFVGVPEDVLTIDATGKTITLEFRSGRKVYRNVDFNITGSINRHEGLTPVCVVADEEEVLINQCDVSLLVCGNNVTEDGIGEQCDNGNLTGETCFSLGYESGSLSCISNCNYNFSSCVVIDDPVVNLESPANGTKFTNQNDITLEYNISDGSSIQNCSLYFNGTLNQTVDSPAEGVTINFTVENLITDNYTWYVTCVDDTQLSNSGTSETRSFEVDVIIGYVNFPNSILIYANNTQQEIWYYALENSSWEGPRFDTFNSQNWLNYVVVEESSVNNEYIVVTIDSNSEVLVQVLSNEIWHHNKTLTTNINAFYRAVDVAYETESGEALVVVNNGDRYPLYYIWNGSDWSNAFTLDLGAGNAQPYWINLESNPHSDEITLVALYSNSEVGAAVWNGTNFTGIDIFTTTAGQTANEIVGLAYEQISGEPMIVWNEVADVINYRQWNGTNWTAEVELNVTSMHSKADWVVLESNPYSDELMLGVLDGGKNINTREWNGTGWDAAHVEITDSAQTASDRCFDIVYERDAANSGNALLVYGPFGQDGTEVREWRGTNWTSLASQDPYVEVDRISVARLYSNHSGIIEFLGADSSGDLHHWYFIESTETWVTSGQNLGEIDTYLNRVSEPFDVVFISDPDTTAPESVTDLQNQSSGTTWIYWSWTNPTDVDYNENIIFIDGVNVVNSSDNFYNATGLLSNTSYTITVHTKDVMRNVNSAEVNSTALTAISVDLVVPASITGLQNQSSGTSWINWSWTNPGDADFYQNIVYINGTNVANTSDEYYNATGLDSDTTHVITIHTMDTNNNINGTDVNSTTKTQVAPDVTPPASITGLQNQSSGVNWIYWTWTNPGDADFNSAIVYINGTNVANSSNNYYNATGLNSDTGYVIIVHVKDNTGNVNSTDVNSTARTDVAPPSWTTIFIDDFNRMNSATVGGQWTETGGEWDILNNRAHADNCDSPGDQITTSNIDLSSKTNVTLSFDWEYVNFDSGECLNLDLNDGGGWVNDVFSQCSTGGNQGASGSETISLLDHITLTATVQLRYDCLSSHTNEEAYVDNVNVSAI